MSAAQLVGVVACKWSKPPVKKANGNSSNADIVTWKAALTVGATPKL